MKNILVGTSILSFLLFLPGALPQDPVVAKKDNLYIEFISDCDWLVWELKGKIKLKADRAEQSRVSFRAWEPNFQLGSQEYRGYVIFRELPYPWARDYLIFGNSAYIATFPDTNIFPSFPGWNYGIHYTGIGGTGYPNAGAIMRVWGPAARVALYDGEALVKRGDTTEYVKVDRNDYLNFPVWQVTLK